MYIHFKQWECWKNGMYRFEVCEKKAEMSAKLLSCESRFFEKMEEVLDAWPNSVKHFLSNKNSNRLSYLGRAACCFSHSSNIECTNKGWWLLSLTERENANRVAKTIVRQFEKSFCGSQLLLFDHKESCYAKKVFRSHRLRSG